MTEQSLTARIDDLAEQKAKEWLEKVKKSLGDCIHAYWWMKTSTNNTGVSLRKVLGEVLKEYQRTVTDNINFDDGKVNLGFVAEQFRTQILDDLLLKLPLVTELARLADGQTEEYPDLHAES
jgi:hypothetical protein